MPKVDVCIIGAGPAGLSVASFIGLQDTVVFEEHARPGIPLHCSSLIGVETARLVRSLVGSVFDASYKRVYFNVFNRFFEVSYKESFIFHVARPELEERLAELVEKRGHRILYKAQAKPGGVNSILAGGGEYKCSMIVVAEGCVGRFRRSLLNSNPRFITGIQSRVRVENIDTDSIYVSYGDLTPGFFSWIIPLDKDTALIGGGFNKVEPGLLDKTIKHAARVFGVKIGSRVETFGGVIPRSKPLSNPVYAGRIVFHGDSVPLVKPYTGGGLHYIFKLSKPLAESIDRGDIGGYVKAYRGAAVKLVLEYSLSELARRLSTGIPVFFAAGLSRLGLFNPLDYDEHYMLALKSTVLALTGILPLTLVFNPGLNPVEVIHAARTPN